MSSTFWSVTIGCSTGVLHDVSILHSLLLKIMPVCATFLVMVPPPCPEHGWCQEDETLSSLISKNSCPSTVARATQFVVSFFVEAFQHLWLPACLLFSKISMNCQVRLGLVLVIVLRSAFSPTVSANVMAIFSARAKWSFGCSSRFGVLPTAT